MNANIDDNGNVTDQVTSNIMHEHYRVMIEGVTIEQAIHVHDYRVEFDAQGQPHLVQKEEA